MSEQMSTDNGNVLVRIETEAIKGQGDATRAQLEAQAAIASGCGAEVDYKNTRGTCGDERERAGLLNGSTEVEDRPSVWGGPDIYGLGISELTGVIPAGVTTGKEALRQTKAKINDAGIKSGGHVNCAANAGFKSWISTIAYSPGTIEAYIKKELGEQYDPGVLAELSTNAKAAVESGRYDDWDETVLQEVLGEEKGEALEVLAKDPQNPDKVKPHEAKTFVRQKKRNRTINQTEVYRRSVYGGGSFVVDEPYAEDIEAAVTSGPDAARLMVLARHAREAINAAVAGAVPNETIYEIELAAA